MPKNSTKTWVEIDQSAYEHNIKILKSLLSPEVTFCSVLKANAYGHGLELMTELGIQNGINSFAVDSIDEAVKIRSISQNIEIYILGYIPEERLRDAIFINAIITIYDEITVQKLAQCAQDLQKTCFVNIKCETGTQRQGIAEKDFKHLLASIEKQNGLVQIYSLASHFSSSEKALKPDITIKQNEIFDFFIETCERFGFKPKHLHISCSASTILYPETHKSLVRIGIAQYGLWPSQDVKELFTKKRPTFQLKPILNWKTRIAQIKDIGSGTAVGYDQIFVSDRPMRIAILPVGYYDGLVRSLSNKGHVIIHGQKCSILGLICMNMCVVNISSVPNANIGDEVIILGRGGMNVISADDHALMTNTIHYEVVTRIAEHIPRILV
ncbi:alanine racemase [Patescibacteria group bacterium]|nr:alanine racemase [Patescibacteria group bacterium]MCG2687894.1 alanine racemase [Candidatus Parcubacteria bacterium]